MFLLKNKFQSFKNKLYFSGESNIDGTVLRKPSILARWHHWNYETSKWNGSFCSTCFNFRMQVIYPLGALVIGLFFGRFI